MNSEAISPRQKFAEREREERENKTFFIFAARTRILFSNLYYYFTNSKHQALNSY